MNTVIGIYRRIFPPEAPPPTVAFGKLPTLPFPERAKLNLNFELETPEGGLPTVPEQLNVYLMPKISANLLSLDFAKEKVKSLGYDTNAIQIDESTYEFKNTSSPSVFRANIVTGTFSLSYDLVSDPSPLSAVPPNPEVAISNAKSFLKRIDSLPTDLENGPTNYSYLKHQSSGLVPVTSLSEANLTKVYLFRGSYDDLPSLTSTPGEANIWFTVSGLTDRGKQIIAGEYHYFPVDPEQKATYPIKTPQAAWEELKSGNYFTASFGGASEDSVTKIRRVYLAYYDPGIAVDFFQPIYVFESPDKNFVAYVPAVTPDYYGE